MLCNKSPLEQKDLKHIFIISREPMDWLVGYTNIGWIVMCWARSYLCGHMVRWQKAVLAVTVLPWTGCLLVHKSLTYFHQTNGMPI